MTLGPNERRVLSALDIALEKRKRNPLPLPAGANEDTQFALWLRTETPTYLHASVRPADGDWTWGTCRECGRVLVGSWYAWTSGVLLAGEVRRYDEPGCYLGSHKDA